MPATIQERLAARPSALHMTLEQSVMVESAFYLYPEWEGLYLFYDGRIEPESWAHRLSSRNACLVSIATEGVPMHISRRGFKKWKKERRHED